MIRSLARLVSISSAVAGCLAACSGAQTASFSGDPGRPIALSEWCRSLTDVSCDRFTECVGTGKAPNDACATQGNSTCLDGRDGDQPSGHNGGDLKSCAEKLQTAACDGYMATVASHTECRPQLPSS